jgi:hypothetical protein
MRVGDIQVKVTYEQIGDEHLLIHIYAPKLFNLWQLLDLEKLSREHGKSVEHLLANLRKNLYKNDSR